MPFELVIIAALTRFAGDDGGVAQQKPRHSTPCSFDHAGIVGLAVNTGDFQRAMIEHYREGTVDRRVNGGVLWLTSTNGRIVTVPVSRRIASLSTRLSLSKATSIV